MRKVSARTHPFLSHVHAHDYLVGMPAQLEQVLLIKQVLLARS